MAFLMKNYGFYQLFKEIFQKFTIFWPRQDYLGLDFYVVLSGPIWSNQVQSGLVWSDLVLAIFFHFIWSDLVRLGINFM